MTGFARPDPLAEQIRSAAFERISAHAAARECIDGPDGCVGPVELRWPGYGERRWPRCEHHGAARVERTEEAALARNGNPDSACPPAGFDPLDAGERWDDDDPWP